MTQRKFLVFIGDVYVQISEGRNIRAPGISIIYMLSSIHCSLMLSIRLRAMRV